MNLRVGRPVSEARAEAPPTRGWRRLCTHMMSQYDAEVLTAVGCPREPHHRRLWEPAADLRSFTIGGSGEVDGPVLLSTLSYLGCGGYEL